MRQLITFFLLAFGHQAISQPNTCLPTSPVSATYPANLETLQNLFRNAAKSAEISPEAYEELKKQINRCNNEMEVALSGISAQMSELSFKYQQILGYKDIEGIEKQLRELDASLKNSKTELEKNLGNVKHSGIFVVLLDNVNYYQGEQKDRIASACQAVTLRAVEDLVGVHIRRSSQERAFEAVRDVVQEIKNGEVRLEREYFNTPILNQFLFVGKFGATPARQKPTQAAGETPGALVLNLAKDPDFRSRLSAKGVSDADIRRVELEVMPFLPNLERDNKTANDRQDYILQNGTEQIGRIERDIEDARQRLKIRTAKVSEICHSMGVPYSTGNYSGAVDAALQKIRDQMRALTLQWNQTAEKEVLYKDSRSASMEGSLPQSLAAETLKLCAQMGEGYGKLDRILQLTEVENFELAKFENSRTATVFRAPQKLWAYSIPREKGAYYGVAVLAQFRVTGVETDDGTGNPISPRTWAKKFDYEPDMVFVEGGTFNMGCSAEQEGDCGSDEKPVHQVKLSGFYAGKHEVTQAQWQAVMGNNPSSFSGCAQCPVENVSWDDVQGYLRKLNEKTGRKYRLLTEAEWEYAARGGAQSKSWKYAGGNGIGDVAWYDNNSGNKTHPVGQKAANELGLFDMSGNVWEWCSDWYGNYAAGAQDNPTGPSSGSYRVIRGGSWNFSARNCRVSIRSYVSPGLRYGSFGFRVASSP